MVHPLRNILTKLLWDARENPADYMITYIHRGAPGDIREVSVSEIKTLGKSYFTISPHPSEGNQEQVTIPFHRILQIRNLTRDEVIWRKQSKMK